MLLAHLFDRAIGSREVQSGVRVVSQLSRELDPQSARDFALRTIEFAIFGILVEGSANPVRESGHAPDWIARVSAEPNSYCARFEINFFPASRDLFGLASNHILDSPLDGGRRVRYIALALALLSDKVREGCFGGEAAGLKLRNSSSVLRQFAIVRECRRFSSLERIFHSISEQCRRSYLRRCVIFGLPRELLDEEASLLDRQPRGIKRRLFGRPPRECITKSVSCRVDHGEKPS
jgi:hypothetical protein